MFHLDLPNVYKVLSNGEINLEELGGVYSGGNWSFGGGNGGGANKEEGGGGGGDGGVAGGEEKSEKEGGSGGGEAVRKKEIVVVSVFGSSVHQAVGGSGGRTRYKRAFQLALDAFGAVGMYGGDGKKVANSTTTEGEGGDAQKEALQTDGTSQRQLRQEDISAGAYLEGFFNEDSSVLFLHIEGLAYDATSCMQACRELSSSVLNDEDGFLSIWSSFNSSLCKWLLLLFSLSHLLILSCPGSSFDTSYISLFRALDALRLNLLSSISKILATIDGLARHWIDHARLCSPRLLFLFQVESEAGVPSACHVPPPHWPHASKRSTREKKDLLQTEIYQIFRKCRIITNISANSLFAVPASEDFIYIFDKSAQNSLHQQGSSSSLAYTYLELISTYSSSTRGNKTLPKPLPIKSHFRSHHSALTYADQVASFRQFLQDNHLSLALSSAGGFDDDYRRVSGNKHFFVRPTLRQWLSAYLKLHHFLIVEPCGSKRISEAYIQMERLINVDSEYLEIQCADLFPKVFLAYQRALPEYYTGSQHQTKLSYAVNLFLNISRGPGVIPWLKKLAAKCEKHWKNGRQQCETLSLLGHVCSQQLHRILRKDHLEIVRLPEMDEELPELAHSSNCRLVSYCNCGKRQSSREEPFTIRQANYEFYRKAGRDCCDKLESYAFSVFTPGGGGGGGGEAGIDGEENGGGISAAVSLQEMIVILQRKSESLQRNLKGVGGGETTPKIVRKGQVVGEDGRLEEVNGRLELATQEMELPEVFEAELRQEEGSEEEEDDEDLEASEEEEEEEEDGGGDLDRDNLLLDVVEREERKSKSPTGMLGGGGRTTPRPGLLYKRNSSTVEYLPGMYHSRSPPGLLPLFPSWSLVCLGPSSIYSHSHGVSQHGFLSGANSLLPWDVKVKAETGVVFIPPCRQFRDQRRRSGRELHRHGRKLRQDILVSSHLPPTATAAATSPSGGGGGNEFSVKVFFGFEYECRKGHRFFCDSDDKVLYALNVGQVNQKALAGKVIGSDMPLYVYCPCKENRDSKQIAQLVRIHVVTPKAPVFVTLHPKVIPGPVSSGAPIFSPSPPAVDEEAETIRLTPSTYWILRLPFSYVGEVVYVPPTDISRYNGRLLKGIFNVVSMSTRETQEWERQNQNRV